MEGVECTRASLVEHLSVSRVVRQVVLPSSAEVTVVVEFRDAVPTEGAQLPFINEKPSLHEH